MDKLESGSLNIVKTCMGLKREESFLVVYDIKQKVIAESIRKKALEICRKVKSIKTPVGQVNGEEPPKRIADEMKKYDVVVIVTTKSLSHTYARRAASRLGVRIASMPGVTIDMIKRTLTADYNKIKKITYKVFNSFKHGQKLRLITKKGTDITMKINPPFHDAGIYENRGDFGNLPAGEAGFAPVQGKTNGTLVIDKTMAGIGKLEEPIKLEIKDGFVNKILGGKEAKKLVKKLKSMKDENVYNVAEFAIGTNYKAKITGKTLEDEKVYGTIHMAIGDNTSYPNGTINAPVHLDCIVSKPTIFIGNKKIMNEGKLLL